MDERRDRLKKGGKEQRGRIYSKEGKRKGMDEHMEIDMRLRGAEGDEMKGG